jgi:CubicO group peptidase (beta-lactamase class C family)
MNRLPNERPLSVKWSALFLAFFILIFVSGNLSAYPADQGNASGTSGSIGAPSSDQAKADKALEAKLKKFSTFMNTEMKRWEVPGIGVGIVKDGKVIFAEGFGLRNVEKNLPVTPDTIFAIGSASKAFTSMDIGILADEGKIDWDKPVQTYLPTFKLKDEVATARMTVRDLVSHKSGLPRHDGMWYGSPLSRKDIFDRLQYLDFSADFRQTFQYNNLMFLTAGYLVGQVTNSTWEEFTQKRIFDALGMTNSNFSVEVSQKSDNYSLPYTRSKEEIKAIPFRNIDSVGPAGSINSTVNDMLKWVLFHLNKGKVGDKQIISEAGQKEMYTPAMFIREPMLTVQPDDQSIMSYGLAWFLETYRGHKLVHHGGSIDGFYFLNCFMPNDNCGAVILTNLSGTPFLQIAMGYVLDMVLGLDPVWEKLSLEKWEKQKKDREEAKAKEKEKEEARVEGTKPSHVPEDYAGEYEHPAYGVIPVELVEDVLKGKFNSMKFKLEHWHYDVFKTVEEEEGAEGRDGLMITFHTNLKGDIDKLSLPLEPAVASIVFTRKASEELKDPKYLSQFVGEYEIMGTTAAVSLQGDALVVAVAGQPNQELVPYKESEFTIKGAEGYNVKFLLENEKATEMVLTVQGNVIRGKRIN